MRKYRKIVLILLGALQTGKLTNDKKFDPLCGQLL